MPDEDLRRLEREAAAGDVTAALHYARALEREGRRAEAARALRPLVEEAEVRSELARYPAWSHPSATPGDSCWVDAEPILSTPRLIWRQRLDKKRFVSGPTTLLASPFGVVAGGQNAVSLLDVDTGAVLWSASGYHEACEVHAEWLHLLDHGWVRRFELATGRELPSVSFPEPAPALLAGGILLARDEQGGLVARGLRPGQDGALLWETHVGAAAGEGILAAGGDLVFELGEDEVRAFDRATGVERWRAPGSSRSFVAPGPPSAVLDLAREVVGSLTPLAIARDVVHTYETSEAISRIAARRLGGEGLWEVDAQVAVRRIAVLDRMMFVLSSDNEVLAFGG